MKGKFVTKINTKNIIKLVTIILVIIAIVFGVKNRQKTENQVSTTGSIVENQDNASLVGYWSASVSSDYGGIGPFTIKDNDGTIYNGGFCMQHGVNNIAGSYNKGTNGYNTNKASMYDIMLNAYYSSDEGEETFYRTKLSKIYENAQNMNKYSIYYQEQLASWGFGGNLAGALINYVSPSVSLKGETKVSVESASADLNITENKWRVGPFNLQNPYNEFFYMNKGYITFTENGTEKTINKFSIIDENGNNVEGYPSSINGWSGNFYIEFNHDFKKGVRYNVKFNNMYAKTYRTAAKYFSTSSGQDVAAFRRSPAPHYVEFNKEMYDNPSTYNMYIVKDGENQSNLPGAEFSLTLLRDTNRKFYTDGSDHLVTQNKQVLIYNEKDGKKNANVEISDTDPDIYEITETKAPKGYFVQNPGEKITIQINKKQIKDGYEIDSITLKYKEKTISETADTNGKQNKWFAIDKNGNVVTLDESQQYGGGPSNTMDYWVAIQFHRGVEKNGYISAFAIKYKDPKATYDLDIDKMDADTKEYVAGAKFTVNVYKGLDLDKKSQEAQRSVLLSEFKKDLSFSLESKAEGGSNNIGGDSGNPVSIDYSGSSDKDIIEINEVKTPNGYILIEEPIYLGVLKSSDANPDGKLPISTVEILNSEAKSQSPVVSLYDGGKTEINIDSTGKENNENPVANISYQGGKITIKWYNPKIKGGYQLYFGKTSRKNPEKLVSDVEYDYTAEINGTNKGTIKKTTEESAIQLESVDIDGNKLSTFDKYTFKESNIGNNKFKLKDYSTTLSVHRTIGSDGKSYIVDYILYKDTKNNKSVKIPEGGNVWIFEDGSSKPNPSDAEKKKAISHIQFTDKGIITFIDIDEDEEPFNFNLFKKNTDGDALNATKFSIKKYVVENRANVDLTKPMTGNGTYVLGSSTSGASLSSKTNNRIDTVEPRGSHPKAYVYEIHETDADSGYINAFKKGDKEIAYLQLMIYENEEGKLNATQEIITTDDCTSDDLTLINSIVGEATIENNDVTLNIENKKNGITLNFQKFTKNVSGGIQLKNGEYLIKFDGKELTSEQKNQINKYGSITLNENELTFGEHTIEFYEIKAPANFENIFDRFDGVDGVITKVVMNEDGTATITENTVRGKKYNFVTADKNGNVNTQEIEEISEYVSVNGHDGNKIYFTIFDPSYITFTLHKMLYRGEGDVSTAKPFTGRAKFEITRTTPTNDIKFNDYIPTDTQTTFFTEHKVATGNTYKYNIVEKDVSNGFDRSLIDKNIQVTVKMGRDGKLTASYDITNVDYATKTLLNKLIKLKYDSNKNTVDLYIANIPEYQVVLHKVDQYGHPVKYPAKFDITTGNTTKQVEITGEAVISDEDETVEFNTTKKYILVETTPPPGFDAIEGRIELDIQFGSTSDTKVIKNAVATYYDKNGDKSADVDVSVKWDDKGTIPIVDLYVPNKSSKPYEFKLIKYGGDKNNKLTSDQNGEGAQFSVDRMLDTYVKEDENGNNIFDYHEAKAIIEAGGNVQSSIFNGVLKEGELIDTLPLGGGFIYRYYIREINTKQGYVNIFKDKIIEVNIYGDYDDNGKACINNYSYSIKDVSNPRNQSDCTDWFTEKYPGCIELTKNVNDLGIETVCLEIVNPKEYKVRINKTDLKGNPVDCAAIEAYSDTNTTRYGDIQMNIGYDGTGAEHIYTGMSSVTSTDAYPIIPNTERIWKIYEKAVNTPYYNIIGADKYIEVKVKMDKDSNITTSYTIKNRVDDSTPSNVSELLKYIKKVEVIDEDGVPIINVTIMNPRAYKLSIAKCEWDGVTELSGATVTLKKPGSTADETVISNGASYYETYNLPDSFTTYTYEIKETATAKYHNNVLKDKTIKLNIKLNSTGDITTWFRIYNADNTIIPTRNEIYDYVKLDKLKYDDNGVPVVGVKILNPKEGYYKVKLVKTDENGTPIKDYPAKFSYSRYNSLVEKIDKTGTPTTNNGQVTIEQNQKIEKINQSFRYVINETEAPLTYILYKDTIQLDVITKDDGQKLTVDKDKTVLTAGGKVINKSTENKANYDNGKNVSWYLDDSKDAVSITLYVKNTKKEFDLALRKNIQTVTNANGTKTYKVRNPELNILSLAYWKRERTAAYFHTKQAVTVESGDTVKYRIRVYNEANIKGYATEITDYIEDGLEFAGDTETNNRYGWKFYDAAGNETKDMSKAKSAKTDYLKNTLLNEFQLQEYLLTAPYTKWNEMIEIECKVVKKPAEEVVYLTNRAEITDHKAVEIDKDGNEVELTENDAETQYAKDRFPDRDSVIENVVTTHKKDMFAYDSNITYSDDKYYEGFQDDDDKDTVTINPKIEYKFGLTKVDGKTNKEIEGATFKVEEQVDGRFIEIYHDSVNKNIEINEPCEKTGKDTVKINTTYTYKITEESSNSNYENLLEGKYIILKTYMDSNKKMHKGIYGNNDENDVYNKYGFAIFDETNDYTYITDSDLYDRILIDISDSYPPKINITIPNDIIITGKYKIDLKKVDEKTGKPIGGIPFQINYNPRTKYTLNTDGILHVTDGYISVGKTNVNEIDTYIIKEIKEDREDSNQNGYILIRDEITLNITKGLNTDEDQYIVTNIGVDYKNSEGEQHKDIVIDKTSNTGSASIYVRTYGKDVKVDIAASPDGTITIKAPNRKKEGEYNLQIYKLYIDNEGVQHSLSGTKFELSGDNVLDDEKEQTTGTNGYTNKINKKITKDNIDNIDKYTIKEVYTGRAGIVGLKNLIELEVSKRETSDRYELAGMNITEKTEDGTVVQEGEYYYDDGTELRRIILRDVELTDGRTADVNADVSGNTINITVENRETPGKINIKIKKVMAGTNQTIDGITFTAIDEKKISHVATTGEIESGIAYIEKDKAINKATSYIYLIDETDIPTTPKNIVKLTDYGINMSFNTKFDEDTGTYIIDKNSVAARVKINTPLTTGEIHERQKEIAEKAVRSIEVDDDGLNITITIENTITTDYGLTIKKADMDTNEEIADAKFTIKEDGVIIAEDKTIESFASRLASKTGVLANTTHKYEIYETTPAPHYKNIFENVYIELIISVDEYGNAAATYTLKPKAGASSTDVQEVKSQIQEYIDSHDEISEFLEKNGNYFTLNIPNPKDVVDIDLNLQKHELGNINKKVDGAVFGVRRLDTKFDDNEFNSVTEKFDTGSDIVTLEGITTSKNRKYESIDHLEGVEIGKVFYYELTEDTVPVNFESKFHKAIIRVEVNEDKSIGTSIIAVKVNSTDAWTEYEDTAENNENVSVEAKDTTVNVKWANQLHYVLILTKRQYEDALPKDANGNTVWTNMELLPGATFTIVPEGKDPLINNETISSTKVFIEKDVNTDTVYKYKITEDEAPEGYYNILEKVEITLAVAIDAKGAVNDKNTKVEVNPKEGVTITDDELQLARESVGVHVSDDNVYLEVANKKITNKFDIKILKVSDKRDIEGNLIGIPEVKFNVMGRLESSGGLGTLPTIRADGYTDENGFLTIPGISPKNDRESFVITEMEVPDGVTKIQGRILLDINTSGISEADEPNEIYRKLGELVDTDGDGVGDTSRFNVSFEYGQTLEATVKVIGQAVVLTIPNPTTTYAFNMFKYDEIFNLLHTDNKSIGAKFDVTYKNDDDVLLNDTLIDGHLHDFRITGANKVYEYVIEEKDPKPGYINVLEGYELHVYIATDFNGKVRETTQDGVSGATYYNLITKDGATPKYSLEEIIENKWVTLTTSISDTSASINLNIINPYEYKVKLEKKDMDGRTPLNKATIVAEKIEDSSIDVTKIYSGYDQDYKDMMLKKIAKSQSVSENKVTLDKEYTALSDEVLIHNNIGMQPKVESAHIWRISETDVEAPYRNILQDKYVIVCAFYREGEIHPAEHQDANEQGNVVDYKYYVVDKEGNDVTNDFAEYVEVSTDQVDSVWNLVVTIKDPMIFKMGLYKKVNSFMDEPLQGANLTLTLDGQTVEIKDGEYKTEMLETELPINSTTTVTVKELSTVKGYTNILDGKTLIYVIRNNNGNIDVVSRVLIDTKNEGALVTGEEYDNIMSHIDLRRTTTEEGYTQFKLYIENPMSFKFDLTKLDIDKNNLDGTKIIVNSSHSGEHVLDGDHNLSFIEENVPEHEIIEYSIKEIHTADGAYVNKFEYPIRIVATAEGGEVKILEKWHQELLPNGSAPMQKFDELEYFDAYVDPADKNQLADGEMQTLTIKMENPPQIEVELIKATAGRYQRRIPNTKFTIVSQDSHTAYTDYQGEIEYLEEIHEPGDYTIRVYEDEVAGPKYVNILENKYMQFDITVTADGTITFDNSSIKFFKKDNDSYFDNDVEITGDEATKIREYCSVWVDNTLEISKVNVLVLNPVKFDFKLVKETTDGASLEGAEFEIVSPDGLFDTIHTTTDKSGEIAKNIEICRPGTYEFNITEIKPAGGQYDNILGDNMIVVYANVEENGDVSLVANKYRSEFGDDVADNQKYIVKKKTGAPADAEEEAEIRKFVNILANNSVNGLDEIALTIVNPVQTKLDIIKRQYNTEGQEEVLTDTRFTVIKNGHEMLLNNAVVNEEVEIEEHNLTDRADYYDIYENSTNTTDGAYVNILNNKFIRVYTELSAKGTLEITNSEGDVMDTFDVYEVQHYGAPRKLDREGNKELYDNIKVWISKNSDGINVLNVKVLNPITINVGVIKKQYGENGQPIPDVSITVVSENTGDHNITSTRKEEVFSEGNIKPGTYDFIVRENDNPNPRYVNVLKDRYAKANVTISKTGVITLNNIKYYTNNNVEITDPEIKSILEETVYAEIDDTNRIQKITFVIENPVTYDFIVHKLDLEDGGLEDATFDVVKYLGDGKDVAKGMTGVNTDENGIIKFEHGDYMKAGIYRYEITELKPAAEKYVNILDCYDDGSQYKVVMYLKLNLDGTTEIVKDAQGTPFRNGGKNKYTIVNRNDETAEIPDEVTEIVHKYFVVERTGSTKTSPDKIDVSVTNTPQIDIDVIKVTKEDGVTEKPLTGTKFSASADSGVGLFEDMPATQDKEYTYKNVSVGRHEFYLTESEGIVNGGYINVLENRYVRVYTTIDADGVMKIMNNNWQEDEDYFEIYDGQYDNRSGSRLLDRAKYAKIYECISVESVKQANGVYKLNLKVNNPERNYNIKLNKKVFGEEDINMEGIGFFIRSSVDNENHQLTTDKDGNLTFEEKRVPVGIYEYYVTETNTSGPEFVNVLENNYILVRLKVNQDGSIEIVDTNNVSEGNEEKYYVLDSKCTTIIDDNDTIVDDFVRVATNDEGDEPELDFFIKDPERINLKLVKRDVLTNEKMNNVTFTTNVFYQSAGASADPSGADKAVLVDAETFEDIDISTIKTETVDGVDGVIMVPNILIDKTGTYTFVFHEESTDGLFKYLYKSHAEDITLKIDISVETNNEGRPIGYKVGQPRIVTGAKYVDGESTLTTPTKAQLVRAEVLNAPIRGHYDLVLSKLDKYTSRKLDGAEFDIRAEKDGEKYELYEDVEDLRIENAIIPDHFTVQNGEIRVNNIRITPPPYQAPAADGTLETFNIILTETKAPAGYMLLDEPIVLEVTTAIEGEYDDAEYVVKSVNLVSGDNYGLVTKTFGKNEINVVAKNEYFDLALRKSIVSVAYSDSDEAKITEQETEDRIPVIYEDDEIYNLNPSVTTANYRHVKNHVRVYPGQEVIYCLRVYNEGEIDGYAEKITDHLPEGLEFLPDDKFNQERGWTYDLTDQSLKTVYTTFLSKESNPNNDRFNAENNLIKAMDENVATGVNHNLDFKEIEIKCKVSDNLRPGVILTNIAEITEYKAEGRNQETVDRDSDGGNADVPEGKNLQNYNEDKLTDNREDYVPGQEDDDDFEKLIVVEFDLALRKYITAINEEEVLADEKEAKYTDEVVEDTEDILGEGTASDDTEGTNEGANTNIVDESEGENGNTEGVNAEITGENPDEDTIADEESDEGNIDDDNTIKYDREPRVNVSTLKSGDLDSIYKNPDETTTALYNHTKDPVEVSVDDIVTYTLEVFNEGTVDGYASLIKDDIPEGVEFVQYTEGDGSVNDKYRWKMVDENDEEVTDPKDAKYIVSDYLSKDNETEENSNLIRAFDPATGTRLDSKYVQVQFRVICKQDYPKIITNYAQISDDTDDGGKSVRDRDSHPNEWIEGEDDQDIEHIWVTYMDLALRKFITGVTDFKTGKTEEITYRIPQVDPTALINETGTTAKYEHTKEPVLVHTNDVVIYTLRIYNEGSKDGYATQIKDDLPEGLEFLPDHEINKYYEWSLVDKNDKPVTRLDEAEYAVTNYLSKDNETEERQNLLKSFDYYDYENDTPAKRETPEWKEIKIAFKVTEPQTSDRILINEAQISEQTDGKGVHREDRDSTPNIWLGEDDEDIEKVRVLYFDLALRKWVTKAIVAQDGKETVFETGHHAEDDPEDVVKVDLKKSKLNKVVVKFEYQIRITNEGEIDGYAKEIKDRIPEGLRFDPADNPTWTQLEENIIVTDQLKDTLLKPGESAEVTVVLTWINSGDNLGLKVNVAEISKDYNDYGTHDIDSTPDNNVWGEDDIDDAPVMLAVKTGNAIFGYIALAVFVGAVIVIGVRRIKKINEG